MQNYTTHFIEDVFHTRPTEVKNLLAHYKLPTVTSETDAWRKLNFLLKKFPNEVFPYLATIHPDKDLILGANKISIGNSNSEDEFSNCCGNKNKETDFSNCEGNPDCNCHLKGKEKMSGCDGCEMMKKSSNIGGDDDKKTTTTEAKKDDANSSHHVLAISIVASIVVLGLIVVATKK